MASRKKPQASRMSDLFVTSEERVKHAQKTFDAARTTLTNAQTFGTEAHAQAAGQALVEAARSYADALRTHAMIVVDYAAERST
jgi:hypothetical protein